MENSLHTLFYTSKTSDIPEKCTKTAFYAKTGGKYAAWLASGKGKR